jgi:L-galactonate dehydratase
MGSHLQVTENDVTVTSFEIIDLRFPTSLDGVGSDAMHVGTNGSHPYVRLKTNQEDLIGEGIVSSGICYRYLQRSLTRTYIRHLVMGEAAS